MNATLFRIAAAGITIAAAALPARSQCPNNLVPNPGFETRTACPVNLSELFRATPWRTPTPATPDHFACTSPAAGVPTNWMGIETGHNSSSGYAGLYAFDTRVEYREYIQVQLTSPLVANRCYDVCFYVSLGESSEFAVSNIGAHLSVGPVNSTLQSALVSFIPQVSHSGGPITQKNGWTQVCGSFTAAGGEDHITIGNFVNDAGTNHTPVPGGWSPSPFAYYYIDDVCVQPCLTCVAPPRNMVLWLPFDEPPGFNGPITRNAVHPNDGRVCHPTRFVLGKVGSCVCSLVNVVVNHYPAIKLPGDFTIDAWILLSGLPGSGKYTIVDTRSPVGGGQQGFWLYVNAAGNLEMQIFAPPNSVAVHSGPPITLNMWQHIAVRVNRGGGSLPVLGVDFILDGVQWGGGGLNAFPLSYSPGNLRVGQDYTFSHQFLGCIDELEIFNRLLSVEEIRGIFEAPGGKCKEFCQVEWASAFCGFLHSNSTITVPVRLCNATRFPQCYNLSFSDSSCFTTWTPPPPFGWTTNPPPGVGLCYTVPENSCITVHLTIPAPSFSAPGDRACYKVCMTNVATGKSHCCDGSVYWTGSACVTPPCPTCPNPTSYTGRPVDLGPLQVANTGTSLLNLPYRISVLGPDRLPDTHTVRLNGLKPGEAVLGELRILPGRTREISLTAEFVLDDPLHWYTILVEGDLDGNGIYEPLQSMSITNTLADECPPALDDNLEAYPLGEVCGLGGWEPWLDRTGVCGSVTNEVAFDGMRSLKIVGTPGGPTGRGDDIVQVFDIEGGVHELSMMTFVPNDATGDAWVIMLDSYPDDRNWALLLQLDADAGLIRDDDNPGASTPLVKGQWVPLAVQIDLDADRVDCTYNGIQFVTGKSWINGSGAPGTPRIEALDLYADEPGRGTTGTYFDAIVLRPICTQKEPCYPDCDQSTGTGVLDIFDFLCFGNKFATNDPYACDCDTSTGPAVCDIFDFLCFGNAFSAGCP